MGRHRTPTIDAGSFLYRKSHSLTYSGGGLPRIGLTHDGTPMFELGGSRIELRNARIEFGQLRGGPYNFTGSLDFKGEGSLSASIAGGTKRIPVKFSAKGGLTHLNGLAGSFFEGSFKVGSKGHGALTYTYRLEVAKKPFVHQLGQQLTSPAAQAVFYTVGAAALAACAAGTFGACAGAGAAIPAVAG